jgi:metal-sulfur cluster biosynthetic enzyme
VLGEDGQRFDVHAAEPMQPDALDELADLRLGPADVQLRSCRPQAAGEHRDVQHERRVCERKLSEIDGHVAADAERTREGTPASSLRCPNLVAAAPEYRRVVLELDDARQASFEGYTRDMASVDDIEAALTNVIDPELGLDFVELGLIYGIEVEGGDVHVTFTLTSPGCPIGPQVSEQIEEFVSEVDGVESVESSMTFSPPWTPDRMTEDAKFALGF